MKDRNIDLLATAIQVIGIIGLTVLAFIFLGCATTKNDTFYVDSENIEQIKKSKIKIGTISVLYENAENEILKNQILEITKLKLFLLEYKKTPKQKDITTNNLNKNTLDDDLLFLNINMQEQSFLSNFENYNSILTIATLTNQKGQIIYQNNFYSKTKDTILSSICQNKEIEKILINLHKIRGLK